MISDLAPTRRDLLLTPLLAAFLGKEAAAAVDPSMTIIRQPDQIAWEIGLDRPPRSVEYAYLYGKPSEPGPYFTLVRWYPGYMSAPHWYETDRYSMVVSGTWWVASGEKFEPEGCVPVPAGGFVHRVARTPHYDGVVKNAAEPAVIAIFGMGPITLHRTDPDKPSWRAL
jgi:hypothetical protein